MDPAPCCQAVARGQQCPEGTARAPSLAAMNQPRDPTSRFLSQTPGPRLGGGGQERAALGGSRGGKGGHLEGRARCPLAVSLRDGERLVCSNWKSSGYNTSFSKLSPKQSCSGKAAFHRTSFGHTALRRTLSSSPPAARSARPWPCGPAALPCPRRLTCSLAWSWAPPAPLCP